MVHIIQKGFNMLKKALDLIDFAFNAKNTNKQINNNNQQEDNISYLIIDEKLYTAKETASLLRCKLNTIYSWKHQNRLIPNKSGGKLLFKGKEIKRFLGIRGFQIMVLEIVKTKCYTLKKGTLNLTVSIIS